MLSNYEKKQIFELIEADQPLPAIYKSKLFRNDDVEYIEATKDYKIVYSGKMRKEDVIAQTPSAPFQKIRSFNNSISFEDDWSNMLVFGDNLMALKAIYEDQKGSNSYKTKNKIKLIYIDPPFATKQDFMKDREKAYRDKIIGAQFIEFLRKRLILMREILAEDGTIYVHLDQKKGHYIKAVLDEVFGEHNFAGEIIWQKVRVSKAQSNNFGNVHDLIFMYKKSDFIKFNTQYVGLSEKYIKSHYNNFEPETNRQYRLCDLTQTGNGPSRNFGEHGEISPPPGKHWIYTQENLDKAIAEGRIVYTPGQMPSIKRYLDESKGTPVTDLWTDIYPINSQASEKLDYPTQKPEDLLARIISASSSEGDIVLDAFAGSGTTLAVAEKLGRRWIGIDCGKLAIYTIQKRLLTLRSQIGSKKIDERVDYQRVEDFLEHSKSKSRGLFFVYEKARKGELVINDTFLENLADFIQHYLIGKNQEEISLVCPAGKLIIKDLEVREDVESSAGEIVIDVGKVRFLISFIQPKDSPDNNENIQAKEFTLYYSGVYDQQQILDLPWELYKPFVGHLFGVRFSTHQIYGFQADGYIGVHSALIWDYPNHKNLVLDRGYVSTLHRVLGGRAGSRFYVIAPIMAMDFMEDEIIIENTSYIFLKVPLSLLLALIQNNEPGSLRQPINEDHVNEVIDAVGYDLISQPEVQASYLKDVNQDLLINIKQFHSNTLVYDPDDFENFETLSIVLVDTNYNGEYFNISRIYWAEQIIDKDRTKAVVRIPATTIEDSGRIMVIFIDMYGNEMKIVKEVGDFCEHTV